MHTSENSPLIVCSVRCSYSRIENVHFYCVASQIHKLYYILAFPTTFTSSLTKNRKCTVQLVRTQDS